MVNYAEEERVILRRQLTEAVLAAAEWEAIAAAALSELAAVESDEEVPDVVE